MNSVKGKVSIDRGLMSDEVRLACAGKLLLPFALPGKRSYQERLSNQFELSSLSQLSFLQDSRN
jgi:hypothetical protein